MNSQFSLWLYPLVIFAIVAIAVRFRLGLTWAWGFIVHALLILIVSLIGLTLGPDWLFAFLAWGLFVLFVVYPRILLSKLEHNLSLLNAPAAMVLAKKLKPFFWGQPHEFWNEMVTANSLFMQRRPDEALSILSKWESAGLPRAVLDVIYTYRLTGLAILGDWQGIVNEYEDASSKSPTVTHRLALAASRAYLELGQFNKATSTLEAASLPESRMSARAAAVTMLPFFCLLGALPEAETLFKVSSEGKETLPEYSKLYWLARCHGARGDNEKARSIFMKCKELAKNGPQSWQIRIDNQLAKLEEEEGKQSVSDISEYVDRGWSIFDRCVFVQSVVAPSRFSYAVGLIMFLILAAFAFLEMYKIVPVYELKVFTEFCFQYGWLKAEPVLHGEYWRLVTYLFLHKHLSHALLNVIGLFWFGRMAENIYGTTRFLAIYLVAGILSGVSHVILDPNLIAIGASGAVMGIFGAVAAGIWRLKDQLPPGVRRGELSWMAGLALAQVVLDQVIPQVAAMAHLGGLLAGFVLGLLVNVSRPSQSKIKAELSAA